MTRKRDEVIDDEGNALPPPDPGSPVAQIMYLLEWGRLRGFQIGPRVQVGDTIIETVDLRQQAALLKGQRSSQPDLVPGTDMHTLLAGDKD